MTAWTDHEPDRAGAVPCLEVGLLGPIQVIIAGVAVGGLRRQERCLLAVLATDVGRAVPTDRLVELIWAGEPPMTAAKVLQVYASRVRQALLRGGLHDHEGWIGQRGGGYCLDVPADTVDAHRFNRLVAAAVRVPDAAARSRDLAQALLLWRGPALADLDPLIRERIATPWEEQRRTAVAARIAADLTLGRGASLIGELTALVEQSPLDERLARYLIVALGQAERRDEALQVYSRVRRRLRRELGLDPGPQLDRAHVAVLQGRVHCGRPRPEHATTSGPALIHQ